MKPIVLLILWLGCSLAFSANIASTHAGKFTVALSSQPSPPVVGNNLLVITVKDGDKPLTGAGVDVHIDMTNMPMPADAKATPGAGAGVYAAPLNFSMAGSWTVDVSVEQMAGMKMGSDGVAHFLVVTGKSVTAKNGGEFPWFTLLAAVVICVTLLTMILYKWLPRRLRGYLAGTLTLLIVLFGTIAVVSKYRDNKTSTVLESATMDMSAQAAPGTTAVATEIVHAAPFQASASYTGTVAADAEEDIYPRVTGRLIFMPFYPGDHIAPGQVVAHLDSTELAAKEQQALQGSAGAAAGVASANADIAAAHAIHIRALRAVDQAQAQVAQAQSAARAADGAVKSAQSEEQNVRLQVQETESAISAAQAGIEQANYAVTQAQSEVESAQAEVAYWTTEIAREQKLYAQGAIAREELERETAQSAVAQAKLSQMKAAIRTAQAGVTRAKAEAAQAQARQAVAHAVITTAEARVVQALAERDSAREKINEMQALVQTSLADTHAAEAGVSGATAKAGTAKATVGQARAVLTEAGTVRGYTTIRAARGRLVTARLLAPGTLVQPGMALLKIAQIDTVRLQVNVSAADIARIRLGQVLTAHIIGEQGDGLMQTIHAHITAIFPTRDTSARTAIVEARMLNPGARLKPGQYLSVSLPLGDSHRKSLSVPTNALQIRDGHASLFVMQSDGMRMLAQHLNVTAGQMSNDRTEITHGLTDGAHIIVSGLANLHDGDAVTEVEQ